MEKTEITIIGAGVVGLSIAANISSFNKNLILAERHESFGNETSSRNSEVIHASIYYPNNSLKGKLCLQGNEMMYELCRKNNIPHANIGKLIVAVNEEEESKLPELLETAKNNGAKDVRIISQKEIKEIEPNVYAKAAILCPTSGIVDSHSLMRYFEATTINNGANIVYGSEVVAIRKTDSGYIVGVRDLADNYFEFESKYIINCAGLGACKISEIAGIDVEEAGYKYSYCKGTYFRVMRNLDKFPKMLIYPSPPGPGTVGIHTTPDLAGGMRLGPDDKWVDKIDYSVDDTQKEYFFESARRFLPYLKIEDLQADSSGIHPKIQKHGEGIRDFIIRHEEDRGLYGFINLVGIESPGLTSSPAIGKYVAEMLKEIIL